MRVFSFIRQMWQVFKTLSFPSLRLSQTPFNPKSLNTQTPSFSSKNLCKITSRYVFLNIVFIFDLDYADFSLGFWKFGTFEKLGWGSYFCDFFFFLKFWLGWDPFDVCVFVLAPWGILSMYWGYFHHVHALFIVGFHCCMLAVWQNVLVTFLCWIGLNWVPMLGFSLDWSCLSCFG